MIDHPMSKQPGTDDAAFERLYRAHHRAILAYCARRVSPSDSWDAAAEVFVIAWRRLKDIPPGEGQRPWLLGAAYRVLSNQRRASIRRALLAGRVASIRAARPSWPEELLIRHEEDTLVLAALASLRPKDREIIKLTIWDELTPVEIAAVLGITREAVDQRYSRARRRISRTLGETLEHAVRITPENGGAA